MTRITTFITFARLTRRFAWVLARAVQRCLNSAGSPAWEELGVLRQAVDLGTDSGLPGFPGSSWSDSSIKAYSGQAVRARASVGLRYISRPEGPGSRAVGGSERHPGPPEQGTPGYTSADGTGGYSRVYQGRCTRAG